jgi:hypothetical protein
MAVQKTKLNSSNVKFPVIIRFPTFSIKTIKVSFLVASCNRRKL